MIQVRAIRYFGLIAVGLLTALVSNAEPLSPAKLNCTRGTNPYQVLKDKLNIVFSDLNDSASALSQRQIVHAKKQATHAKREWVTFLESSQQTGLDVPSDLREDVDQALEMIFKASAKKEKSTTTEEMRRVAKKVGDYSMTLTCPD